MIEAKNRNIVRRAGISRKFIHPGSEQFYRIGCGKTVITVQVIKHSVDTETRTLRRFCFRNRHFLFILRYRKESLALPNIIVSRINMFSTCVRSPYFSTVQHFGAADSTLCETIAEAIRNIGNKQTDIVPFFFSYYTI